MILWREAIGGEGNEKSERCDGERLGSDGDMKEEMSEPLPFFVLLEVVTRSPLTL